MKRRDGGLEKIYDMEPERGRHSGSRWRESHYAVGVLFLREAASGAKSSNRDDGRTHSDLLNRLFGESLSKHKDGKISTVQEFHFLSLCVKEVKRFKLQFPPKIL